MGIMGGLIGAAASRNNRNYNELIRREIQELLKVIDKYGPESILDDGVTKTLPNKRYETINQLIMSANMRAQLFGTEFVLDSDLAESFNYITRIRLAFESNRLTYKKLDEEQKEFKSQCERILKAKNYQDVIFRFNINKNHGYNGYGSIRYEAQKGRTKYSVIVAGRRLFIMPYSFGHNLMIIVADMFASEDVFDSNLRKNLKCYQYNNENISVCFDENEEEHPLLDGFWGSVECVVGYKDFEFRVRFERKIYQPDEIYNITDAISTQIDEGYASKVAATTNLVDCDNMDGHEFESFCAKILRQNGYKNVSVTQGSGDQGIDVIAFRDGIKYGIQCKCYSADIGNKAVQEVFAGKTFYHCHVGIVLTNRYFTKSAIELARVNGVVLWDRDKLIELIDNAIREK